MVKRLFLLLAAFLLVACGGSLSSATSTPESTPTQVVEVTSTPAPIATIIPDTSSANEIVCETIRTTVSGGLSDAVDAYVNGIIDLYDLGTIYMAWASGARGINASASGAVEADVSYLIKLAERTGNAAQSGRQPATVDGVTAFASALDSLTISCP
jgi:type IV pilus biogenesis protein CpaD/CtpE